MTRCQTCFCGCFDVDAIKRARSVRVDAASLPEVKVRQPVIIYEFPDWPPPLSQEIMTQGAWRLEKNWCFSLFLV